MENGKSVSRCYDTYYWQTLLIIVLCCIFGVVVAISIIVECKRRRDKRNLETV
jgi:hypothetical protein